jgi:hypothetical protein
LGRSAIIGKLRSVWESRWPEPLGEATPAWLHSCPPKRLFGFENDIAPGKADIVQFSLRQFSQLAPLVLALAPDMQGLRDLREKAGTMMIYHRFMCESGHFYLLS